MVRVDANEIVDADTFHAVFADAFGFPEFYGRNMNAWIDCMGYLDDPDAEMSSVHVRAGQSLTLVVDHAESFKLRCPELFWSLVECTQFVNQRCIDAGAHPILDLKLDSEPPNNSFKPNPLRGSA